MFRQIAVLRPTRACHRMQIRAVEFDNRTSGTYRACSLHGSRNRRGVMPGADRGAAPSAQAVAAVTFELVIDQGALRLDDLTCARLEAWLNDLLRTDPARRSIEQAVATLRVVLSVDRGAPVLSRSRAVPRRAELSLLAHLPSANDFHVRAPLGIGEGDLIHDEATLKHKF